MNRGAFLLLSVLVISFVLLHIACSNNQFAKDLYNYLSAYSTKRVLSLNGQRAELETEFKHRAILEYQRDDLDSKLRRIHYYCQGDWGGYCYYLDENDQPAGKEYFNLMGEKLKIQNDLYGLASDTGQVSRLDNEIATLDRISKTIEQGYKTYKIRQIRNGVYVIDGYGLGINDWQPCLGSWYYYQSNNNFEPADMYAQELLTLFTRSNHY